MKMCVRRQILSTLSDNKEHGLAIVGNILRNIFTPPATKVQIWRNINILIKMLKHFM